MGKILFLEIHTHRFYVHEILYKPINSSIAEVLEKDQRPVWYINLKILGNVLTFGWLSNSLRTLDSCKNQYKLRQQIQQKLNNQLAVGPKEQNGNRSGWGSHHCHNCGNFTRLTNMRGERPHLNFCHALISKCPSAWFQPNPHLKWPTLAVHYNNCTADIGHPRRI